MAIKKVLTRSLQMMMTVALVITLSACGSSDGGSPGVGSLKTKLSDSSTEDYQAVYVSIKQVEVSRDGSGWEVVATPGATYQPAPKNPVCSRRGYKVLTAKRS